MYLIKSNEAVIIRKNENEDKKSTYFY